MAKSKKDYCVIFTYIVSGYKYFDPQLGIRAFREIKAYSHKEALKRGMILFRLYMLDNGFDDLTETIAKVLVWRE